MDKRDLKEVYRPIQAELKLVKKAVKNQLKIDDVSVSGILTYFFKRPGKLFRPALVILSAKTLTKGNGTPLFQRQMVNLAAAVELIHDASLIHDDVIDEGRERRQQLTLHRKYGNRTAIMTGDFLYSRAFSFALELPGPVVNLLCRATARMCLGEIQELKIAGAADYLQMIENKTAFFISACCQAAGMIAGARSREVKNLADYGLHLGMAYQVRDDLIDREGAFLKNPDLRVKELAVKAKKSIRNLPETIFKEKMLELADYLLITKGGAK